MTAVSTTPQIWLGCLAAYNAGALHGEWVDATDPDEIDEAGKRIIRTSPAWRLDGHAEELFVADYDNFPRGVIDHFGEYPDYVALARVAKAIEDAHDRGAFEAWLDCCEIDLSNEDALDGFDEAFQGRWGSERAYAEDRVRELGLAGVPGGRLRIDGLGGYGQAVEVDVIDELLPYLDMDAIAREQFQHGTLTSAPAPGGDVYVFDTET